MVVIFVGCGSPEPPVEYKFKMGEIVYVKATGDKCTIISTRGVSHDYPYKVRRYTEHGEYPVDYLYEFELTNDIDEIHQ